MRASGCFGAILNWSRAINHQQQGDPLDSVSLYGKKINFKYALKTVALLNDCPRASHFVFIYFLFCVALITVIFHDVISIKKDCPKIVLGFMEYVYRYI